jgi:hypothetical protein
MASATVPLSSTVTSIFDQFFKKLEADKTLESEAFEALKESFENQKFDHESLRRALFTQGETAK